MSQELLKGYQFNAPSLVDIRIVPYDLQAEGPYPFRYLPTNPPAANNAISHTFQTMNGNSYAKIPGSQSDGSLQGDNLSHQGEKEGQGVVGNLFHAIVRDVGNDDSQVGGGFYIDRVHPHTISGKNLTPG